MRGARAHPAARPPHTAPHTHAPCTPRQVPNTEHDREVEQMNQIRRSLGSIARNSTGFGLRQPHLERTRLCELNDSELDPGYVRQRDDFRCAHHHHHPVASPWERRAACRACGGWGARWARQDPAPVWGGRCVSWGALVRWARVRRSLLQWAAGAAACAALRQGAAPMAAGRLQLRLQLPTWGPRARGSAAGGGGPAASGRQPHWMGTVLAPGGGETHPCRPWPSPAALQGHGP
jgi:hypothetical protein